MFSSNTTQVSSGGYEIQRSLRFNSADTAFLNRTPASASNRRTWTWSAWVKRSALSGSRQGLFVSVNGDGSVYTGLEFNASNQLASFDSNATGASVVSSQVFRDVSAWYHIVWAYDTTQSTAANRVRLYVNGVEITAFSNASYPTQNSDSRINTTNPHFLGDWNPFNLDFDGYMTEVNFIDGQALTPSSFGAFDAQTGVWGPIRYAGSYGTNGFYLNFSNNSNTTAATLGADYSGNGNNWTPNNFSVSAGAGNDSLVDSPTSYGTDTGVGGTVRGNYCTMNPLDKGADITLSNGNLDFSLSAGTNNRTARGTMGMSSGKWYWEGTLGSSNVALGIATSSATLSNYLGSDAFGWSYYSLNGNKINNVTQTSYGAGYTTGDTIGIAFDADAGTLVFYKNGTSQGTAFTGLTNGPYFPAQGTDNSSVSFNFGQRPFAYTAPSGFKALNTQNLPTPTIGATPATQAGKFFNPVLYTGNGFPTSGTQSVSGVGFQPDWVWIKSRSAAGSHTLTDVVRGINSQLLTNTTGAQETNTDNITALNSDGFSLGSNTTGSTSVNVNGQTYVAWNWKANGAGVTNTAGSITSTVSANTTSGFSVVTYTGTGSAGTVGHGLGVAPRMIIVKDRTSVANWYVWHQALTASQFLLLNQTSGTGTSSTIWNNLLPTSTVFGSTDWGSDNIVAYCFAEVPGYSRFGSYTGNGSSDGPFVFTGFRPEFVMAKASTVAGDWWINDAKRSVANQTAGMLRPNLSNAEYTASDFNSVDILSNGFKVRTTNTGSNENGQTYIFVAFASNPFKYSLAR